MRHAIATVLFLLPTATLAASRSFDIVAPDGPGLFGESVLALPNGNIAVAARWVDVDGRSNAGAVYLFDAQGRLISRLVGASASDEVGGGGLIALPGGDFLALSPRMRTAAGTFVGAVTWIDGDVGLSGVVSADNSLVGANQNDQIGIGADENLGQGGVTVLANGDFVVSAPAFFDQRGAVAWRPGDRAAPGVMSSAIALVGSRVGDRVGARTLALADGSFVVGSPSWDSADAIDVGAATHLSGTQPTSAVVGPANSLVGSTEADAVGERLYALGSSSWIVASSMWDNGALADVGAVTRCTPATCIGAVSAQASLVGATAADRIGTSVTVLTSGAYVVGSHVWRNASVPTAGAATFVSPAGLPVGPVTAANSLVGTQQGDFVSSAGIIALANGHYVVLAPNWNDGALSHVGAVTWGDGNVGISGPVSAANSLVGSSPSDFVGGGAIALTNGNYVVRSPSWNGRGAATWRSGAAAHIGVVSPANSLVDTSSAMELTALVNGNYVVGSPLFDANGIVDAGAITWADGTTGTSGSLTTVPSLVGSSVGDRLGESTFEVPAVTPLANGHYVVRALFWDAPGAMNAGAVAWRDGTQPATGTLTPSNALVGDTEGDLVGAADPTDPRRTDVLPDGNYVVSARSWQGAGGTFGALTLARGDGSTFGNPEDADTVVSNATSGGWVMHYDYDPSRERIVVGKTRDDVVTVLTLTPNFGDGFE